MNHCDSYQSDYVKEEFWLVTVFGDGIALLSILLNLLLLYFFLTRRMFLKSYFFYLCILAGFDVAHSLAYILVFGVVTLYEYVESERVMEIWFGYVLILIPLAEGVRLASVYILVAASVERYIQSRELTHFCTRRRRSFAVLGVTLFSFLLRIPQFFEYTVLEQANCSGTQRLILARSELALDADYNRIWSFWTQSFICVFFPYILLVVLNLPAVLKSGFNNCPEARPRLGSKRKLLQATGNRTSTEQLILSKTNWWLAKARSRIRKAATRSFIIIIIESIVSSGFGVFISAWEHVNVETLRERRAFYTFSSDWVSILSVLSCVIRLPTYCLVDVTFRKELYRTFWRILCCSGLKKNPAPTKADAEGNAEMANLVWKLVENRRKITLECSPGTSDSQEPLLKESCSSSTESSMIFEKRRKNRVLFREIAHIALAQQKKAEAEKGEVKAHNKISINNSPYSDFL